MKHAVIGLVFAACASDATAPRKLQLIEAPGAGDVEAIITTELSRAIAASDSLLVYVGAEWCEPCRDFHAAAAAGKLDDDLGGVRLLELDADRDGDALAAAGYDWSYIPLFAVPRIDGRASGKQIEGAIKGQDAASQLVPQLQKLLGR